MPAPDFSSPRAGASQPPAPTASSIHAGIVRSAGVVSAAVLFSRITGLVREVVFAKYFGAGMVYDAFVAAFRIPNLLRDLLAEGALSAAFVTTFSQRLSTQGEADAFRLSNRLATVLTPMLAAVFTVAIYVVGHLTWGLTNFVEVAPGAATQYLVTFLYYALPDLETFNVRSRVVHGLPVSRGYVLDAVGYAMAYSAGMLAIAVIVFRRRDLT